VRRLPAPLVVTVRASKLSQALKKVTDAVEKSACLAVADAELTADQHESHEWVFGFVFEDSPLEHG
jgi:RecA/RadA recombinase